MATTASLPRAPYGPLSWGETLPHYPYDVKKGLTQNELLERINNVHKCINLHSGYYDITYELDATTLATPKWKTYLFLRKCVLDYRAGNKDELLNVLQFLETNKNKTWLAKRLLDPNRKMAEEQWGTSQHEWIERSLIVEVLKRSAGMVEGVECETEFGCIAEELDWIYLQAVLRSSTKYIFFKNEQESIEAGHVGAVKKDLKKRGFVTEGSYNFHGELKRAFLESVTIAGCLIRINNIFKTAVYSGKKHISPSKKEHHVVDGTYTSDSEGIDDFRVHKLRPEGYNPFNEILSNLINFATNLGDREDIKEEEIDSESSDDDILRIAELKIDEESSESS